MDTAKNIEAAMIKYGLDEVKIYSSSSECVVVQGKLNSNYILIFKTNNDNQEEYYTVLKNNTDERNIAMWKKASTENFALIVESAKIYTAINLPSTIKSTKYYIKKSHYQLIMTVSLTLGIALCGILGIYLGNQIRNLCSKSQNSELIR